ncbi:MAG: hypothetical protein HYY40_12040 [Bacteroidetes bacterium]|nr:hypothetical protein [Bacteroidota bacterium]
MNPDKNRVAAIMNVDDGEEIAGMWVSPHIAGTGVYKMLAKKRKDNRYEWAHFVQRDNGVKDSVYRGDVESKEQLEQVLTLMNGLLSKIFGKEIKMQTAKYDTYVIGGGKGDGTIN